MPVNAVSANTPATSGVDQQKAFRETDFMKIILAEITQQDPFKPQETSKIVDDMQKLQELANSKYEKFRDDQRWARDLMGQPVSVGQMAITETEAQTLRNQGIQVDVGYGQVTGTVDTYRVVGETVYVTVGDKDYPIDNVRQVQPDRPDGAYLASLSQGLLGGVVRYPGADGAAKEGLVSAIALDPAGEAVLTVAGEQVPLASVTRIRTP